MDLGDSDTTVKDGYKLSAADDSEGGLDDGEGGKDDDETSSLLPSAMNGGIGGKRRKISGRKVTWNDLNGNKLVEILEFYPSDSSDDSDDEDDDCVCTIIWLCRLLLHWEDKSSPK